MPDKDNLGAVLQPIGYRWQNNRDGLQQDDAVAALRASAGNSVFHEMNHPVVAVGFNWQNGGGYGNANDGLGITVEGTGPLQRCNTPAVATSFIPGNSAAARSMGETEECCVTIKGDGGGSKPHVQYAMTVRRLTPRECERLQGFPDDYTLIPWRKKQAEDCPDGPRYKALGNSMAVNCMSWIGERIAALENKR
jgi:DNA (cytosine-5)-methyltransferase 1